jgi:hypothetical protein
MSASSSRPRSSRSGVSWRSGIEVSKRGLTADTQSLPEWYAYVPSKMDYSDLFSILSL